MSKTLLKHQPQPVRGKTSPFRWCNFHGQSCPKELHHCPYSLIRSCLYFGFRKQSVIQWVGLSLLIKTFSPKLHSPPLACADLDLSWTWLKWSGLLPYQNSSNEDRVCYKFIKAQWRRVRMVQVVKGFQKKDAGEELKMWLWRLCDFLSTSVET